jgi:flagellar hook-associated protein 3 FlgL
MIYDSGVAAIQKKTTDLLNVQQQMATGRRMLTPSDDPVAAAQALEVTQSMDINTQFQSNQQNAKDTLSLSESQLQSAGDVLTQVRQLTTQLGNPSLSDTDRKSIASQLRQDFSQLMGIANTQDGTGNYLYSGFRGDTQPFTGSADTGVTYNGDNGQRELPVTATHSLAISDSGQSIFLGGPDASVPFATAADPLNKSTATIGSAAISDANKWNAATNGKNYTVKFAAAGGVTTYDIVDSNGNSLLTNAPATNSAPLPGVYQSGTAIQLKALPNVVGGADLGASVTINGSPSNGDTFTIRPSAPASIFGTIANLIKAAETPTSGSSTASTALSSAVAAGLSNIDTAQNNILTVTANIGSRMNQADALISTSGQTKLNYQNTLSQLQDLDYASAVTNLNKNQVNLQAAEQSFTKVTQLSLFNYL